jgi:UPF0042 nucleotide-binding protein
VLQGDNVHVTLPFVAPHAHVIYAMSNESATADQRQRLLLVTGLLGAGKTTALKVLEDLGWETIDNFPIRLLDRLIDVPKPATLPAPLAIGFDCRTRVFLDCSSAELERRYNETRRRHPLAADMPATAGIRAERELLEPLRRWADLLIDTSQFNANALQQVVRERFAPDEGHELTLTISSFGFARGMPPVADLVFDMRFLDNPHWADDLREQTGLDPAVGDYIRQDPAFAEAFERISGLITMLLPRYRAQGKAYVHVAFGCTGGRHRSVFMAEQVALALRQSGFSPTLLHGNLGSRAADLLEGGHFR